MFYRFGLIDVSDEVKEKMKQPKKRKKSGCYAQKVYGNVYYSWKRNV